MRSHASMCLLGIALIARASARAPFSFPSWTRVPHGGSNSASTTSTKPILVVGSINVDITYEVNHFPSPGETVTTTDSSTGKIAAGGKGANQAVAAALLSTGTGRAPTQFVGQFGNDPHVSMLEATLTEKGVDVSGCGRSNVLPSGQGLVFLQPSGTIASVVVGGANQGGWPSVEELAASDGELAQRVAGAACVLLQREVPEVVNEAVCALAERFKVPVHQDAGGMDCSLVQGEGAYSSSRSLQRCTYFTPNLTELARLTTLLNNKKIKLPAAPLVDKETGAIDEDAVVTACRMLQKQGGARNVLVTLGAQGYLLVCEPDEGPFTITGWDGEPGALVRGSCCPLASGESVVDETGAGDCFRAGFAVALSEGQPLSEALKFATACGACAVTQMGAVPSVPSRKQVELALNEGVARSAATLAATPAAASAATPAPSAASASSQSRKATSSAAAQASGLSGGSVAALPPESTTTSTPSSSGSGSSSSSGSTQDAHSSHQQRHRPDPLDCPWGMASRLNSMKDRPDLWLHPQTVTSWVQRQGTIPGLTLVDFNYPQHLRRDDDAPGPTGRLTVTQAREALDQSGLAAGAVCLRYPQSQFRAGALTAPDPQVRAAAVSLTIEAGQAAIALGAKELVIWSAFDGYDYPLQVNHEALWQRQINSFRAICDALPELKVSLEFKPTDENTRWFTVPSTGSALLLCRDVNRLNFGLTLDVGHCLAAGENPAQSASLVAREGKLFGVQLNDGYTRLGAEDGLCFASVHPHLALELVVWLVKSKFEGHCYFDTFPRNEDPVQEAARNVATTQRLWARAMELLQSPDSSSGCAEEVPMGSDTAESGGSVNIQNESSSSVLSRVWRHHDGLAALELAEN